MSEITIILSATSMTWEDMALYLGTNTTKPNNFDENEGPLYFFMDGPAAPADEQHPDPASVKFDPQAKNGRMLSGTIELTKNERKLRQALGHGMKENAHAAVEIVNHLQAQGKNIDKINLVGFSRGGATTHLVANKLKQDKTLKEIPVDILAADGVPGLGNFDIPGMTTIPNNVRKYISVLGADESLIGFEPLSREHVTIEDPEKTNYAFFTLNCDHLDSLTSARTLIRTFLPRELYPETQEQAEKVREILEKKYKADAPDSRMIRYYTYKNNQGKYERQYILDPDNPDYKDMVKKFCKFNFFDDHFASLQSEAIPSHGKVQRMSRQLGNQRAVSKNLNKYTNPIFFVNKLHESAFAKAYPHIYQLLSGKDYKSERVLFEFANMDEYTKEYFIHLMSKFHVENNNEKADIPLITELQNLSKHFGKPQYTLETTNIDVYGMIDFLNHDDKNAHIGFNEHEFLTKLSKHHIQDVDFKVDTIGKIRTVMKHADEVIGMQAQLMAKNSAEISESRQLAAKNIIGKLQDVIMSCDWNINIGGVDVVMKMNGKLVNNKISSTMKTILDIINFAQDREKIGSHIDWERVLLSIAKTAERKTTGLSVYNPLRPRQVNQLYQDIVYMGTSFAQKQSEQACAAKHTRAKRRHHQTPEMPTRMRYSNRTM